MKISELRSALCAVLILSPALFFTACSTAESKTSVETTASDANAVKPAARKGATIKIEPNSPADIVRVFYAHLREKRFREAIYLTNLRPAIEQLSDTELKDYEVDLSAVARHVPADIEINGEITSGNSATVTAILPGEELDRRELQELRLRKEKSGWVILSVDEYAEKRIKQAGKNYLRVLRIETHQDEAKAMLDRIAKAQMAYATTNGGNFADIRTLVDNSLLPADALSAESTGYMYSVVLTDNGAGYYATATPAEYGKSGLMSFIVKLNEKNSPLLSSKDMGGKPMQN